jgi:hypothetical protein
MPFVWANKLDKKFHLLGENSTSHSIPYLSLNIPAYVPQGLSPIGPSIFPPSEKPLNNHALGWFREGGFRTKAQILNTLGPEGVILNKTLELDLDAVFIEIKKRLIK